MQVQMRQSAKGFDPITFTVTVESADELRDLWHRLDVGMSFLRGRYQGDSEPRVAFPGDMNDHLSESFFSAVDGECVSRELRPGGRIGHR